jgi:hypothetical protein
MDSMSHYADFVRDYLPTYFMVLFSLPAKFEVVAAKSDDRVARFFLVQNTKYGTNVPNDQKYTI